MYARGMLTCYDYPTVSLTEFLSATCLGFSAPGQPGVGTGWGKLEGREDGLGVRISPVSRVGSSQIFSETFLRSYP